MTEAKPEVLPPEVQRVPTAIAALQDLDAVLARANQVVQVTTQQEYEVAVVVCGQIKRALADQERERLEITRPMDQAKDRIMALFKRASDPLTEVDKLIRGKLNAYNAKQRQLADEKRRQAEAEAERQRQEKLRKAREEQEKADAKARAERQEAERQRQEEERQRREAEEARRRGDIEAARAKEVAAQASAAAARKAESKAETIATAGATKAQDLHAQAATIVAPMVEEAPKVAGSSRRKNWKYRVTDPAKVDRRFLMLDDVKIGKQVRALGKEAEELVGGIVVEEDHNIGIKAAK
jgi:hypothetical protein